jgi:uncharacterized membrane protein (UPF0127 family)
MKRSLAILFLGALILGGCAQREKHACATVRDYEPLAIGNVPIRVQVAITEPEQEKGLMYRTSLADGDGMIFVYKTPMKMDYWMNHVPIKLSIGFILPDGTLDEVRPMLPNDTRNIESANSNIQDVLEMNERWYERHGVKPGAKLDMAQLAKALKARGEETAAYGLK